LGEFFRFKQIARFSKRFESPGLGDRIMTPRPAKSIANQTFPPKKSTNIDFAAAKKFCSA
jgi:hypothetical protein